jgi:osmotically-inducible protein OsmY
VTETREPASYQAERIRAALASDARVNELGIIVTITGSKVFLTGVVATAERQRGISGVVAELCPEYEIHNDVTIHDLSKTPERETLE